MSSNLVQFVPFSSAVEAPFWHTLSTRKIDLYKLDDAPQNILGYYSVGYSLRSQHATEANITMPARLYLGTGAFDTNTTLPPFTYPSPGAIKNTNTIEEFKTLDKTALFKGTAEQIWQDIISGAAVKDPYLLTRFILVTFADLKKYKYYYWFGFPALLTEPPWIIVNNEVKGVDEVWDSTEKIVGFADPSSLPTNPGWPLRNLLALLKRHWNVNKIKVICYREIPSKKDISNSRILTVEIPDTTVIPAVGWEKNLLGKLGPRTVDLAHMMDPINEGHDISIPMPGHPITSESQVKADVEKLIQLIESHDVIFLLMDSRESRWLPTLLGASMRKLVINAALGFDTYVVMRHGVKDDSECQTTGSSDKAMPPVKQLGCYFCNDVVAPTDSLKDRTLDQQCTVTRPGLSAIASAYAVELMVSVLHHEKGPAAPADTNAEPTSYSDFSSSSPLGIIPHQMRGFLTHFNNMIVVGQAYERCTACSEAVLNEYKTNGFEFLKRAFNSPACLEEVTGLTKLHQESEVADDFDWDEEDTEL
ncbi:16546_t:CDS:2 [Racocetra fulgida]|uniref:Ubiquitin-like modifier-activating enzyme ATG7 n=1 Tax=Racocetra fulgida TaxID=60492 RepID=A0A9N9DTR3_9GLOM|nr:16546_t:CDS:2 [Racocetra fulgida]